MARSFTPGQNCWDYDGKTLLLKVARVGRGHFCSSATRTPCFRRSRGPVCGSKQEGYPGRPREAVCTETYENTDIVGAAHDRAGPLESPARSAAIPRRKGF